MTWLLVSVGYLILVVLIGRWVRYLAYRQFVLSELLLQQGQIAEYWERRIDGLIQMRVDFGDVEALMWFDRDMIDSHHEILELLDRGEKLLDQL